MCWKLEGEWIEWRILRLTVERGEFDQKDWMDSHIRWVWSEKRWGIFYVEDIKFIRLGGSEFHSLGSVEVFKESKNFPFELQIREQKVFKIVLAMQENKSEIALKIVEDKNEG